MRNKILALHQKRMQGFSFTHKRSGMFADMRLGKTLVTTRLVRLLDALGDPLKRVLVVTPLSAFSGWFKEVKGDLGETPIKLTGSPKNRLKSLQKGRIWNLLNWEGYTSIKEPLLAQKWDLVVLDESHKIKNPKTKVSKFFTRNFRDVERKLCLTGTPDPESRLDFFQQMLFLNPAPFGCKDYWHFRGKYFRPAYFDWKITKLGQKVITRYLKEHALFEDYKSAGIKRKRKHEIRTFKLPSSLRKVYKVVEEEFVLETKHILEMSKYAGQKYVWLRRLACGILKSKLVWKGKAEDIANLCRTEFKNQQVVVWCNFVDEVDLLEQYLNKKKVKAIGIHGSTKSRQSLEREFMAGKPQVLVAQATCYTYGVDFSNADVEFYHSCPFSNVVRMQTERRLFHLKKKRSVLIVECITQDTVDVEIYGTYHLKLKGSQKIKHIVQKMEARNEN